MVQNGPTLGNTGAALGHNGLNGPTSTNTLTNGPPAGPSGTLAGPPGPFSAAPTPGTAFGFQRQFSPTLIPGFQPGPPTPTSGHPGRPIASPGPPGPPSVALNGTPRSTWTQFTIKYLNLRRLILRHLVNTTKKTT